MPDSPRKPPRVTSTPMHHRIGELIDAGEVVIASCGGCGFSKVADLEAMAAKLGRDFSLHNYRCRCRNPACANLRGWVKFSVKKGMRSNPLVDEAVKQDWLWGDDRRWKGR